jgi:hypothetical protein
MIVFSISFSIIINNGFWRDESEKNYTSSYTHPDLHM